jgi:HSP20 family molecular chaperone IbpA
MSTALTQRQSNQIQQHGNRVDRQRVAPPCDIYENDAEYLIACDVPGATEQGLDLRLDAGQLTITARVEEPTRATVQREYRLPDYERTFQIPRDIDRANVAADLKQGVLWVHLPKSPAMRPRRIEIRSS